MKAIYRPENAPARSLTSGGEYHILGITSENFIVLDNDCEPILFPQGDFHVVDPRVPSDWIWKYSAIEDFWGLASVLSNGDLEKFHDGDQVTISKFNSYLQQLGITCNPTVIQNEP